MSEHSEKRKEKKKAKKEKRAAKWASYTKLDKQHLVYIGIMSVMAVVLLIWGGSAYVAEPETETTKAPEITTTVPATTEPTTNEPPVTTPTEPSKPDEPTKDNGKEEPTNKPDTSQSKEEILKKVVDGVNSLKASDASFKGTKDQYIDIKLTDCSVPQVVGIINGVLERFLGEEKLEYDFTNGVSKDPEGNGEVTSMTAIPPSFIEFGLTADGVTNAYVEKDGANTKYTVEVVAEDSSLGEKPYHHSKACDVMSLETLNIPAKITRADYTYSGTKISVTYNAEGKVIEYHEYFDMKGDGEGGAMGVTATLTLEGYFDETWYIEWK
ncbi:MAG: hypothetical protein IKJ70_03785 [Clostridia bacterium]|nr:hypothetical protein [Clostridia bacterium]